ncbi:MAG TPA: hypothetical protein VKW08_00470 [Xanthobacteraceae bacterium]|jgi:hypothetical protein|nr:hypothetical protein [Xanthobacteraceae bacterium]
MSLKEIQEKKIQECEEFFAKYNLSQKVMLMLKGFLSSALEAAYEAAAKDNAAKHLVEIVRGNELWLEGRQEGIDIVLRAIRRAAEAELKANE